jgi:hypothetical protein
MVRPAYLIILCVMFSVVVSPAVEARTFPDYLSKWFPKYFAQKDEGPDPAETLTAPFMDPPPVDAGKEIGVPYNPGDVESTVQLFKPHRQSTQIGQWASVVVSQTLNFEESSYQSQMKAVNLYYSPRGIREFQEFLKSANVMPTLKREGWKLASFVEEQPLLRNEGEVGDRYRWLFQVPVTLSFLPLGETDYASGNAARNERIDLIVQVGRVKPFEGNDIGLIIESWSVKARKR